MKFCDTQFTVYFVHTQLYSKVYFWNFVFQSLLFNLTTRFITHTYVHTYIRINKLFCVCRMTHSNVRERSASKWIHTELKFRVSVPLFYSLCVCMYNLEINYTVKWFFKILCFTVYCLFQSTALLSLISKHGRTHTRFKFISQHICETHTHTVYFCFYVCKLTYCVNLNLCFSLCHLN